MDLSERPPEADSKGRVGDWELDTVVGNGHRGYVVTAVDGHSKYTLLRYVPRKTAAAIGGALVRALEHCTELVHIFTSERPTTAVRPPAPSARCQRGLKLFGSLAPLVLRAVPPTLIDGVENDLSAGSSIGSGLVVIERDSERSAHIR